MEFIPLSSFVSLFNSIIAFGCAAIIFLRSRSAKKENVLASNFTLGLFFTGLQFFFFSLPGIFIFDPKIIQVVYIIGHAFILTSMKYLIFMPLKIFSKKEYFIKISSWVLIGSAIFYVVVSLILLEPVEIIYFKPFIDWRELTPPFLQALEWVLAAGTVLGIIFLFTVNGWFHKDDLIRKRSRAYAIGFLFIFIGWLSIIFFSLSLTNQRWILVGGGVLGCVLISLGMILLLVATMSKNISMLGIDRPEE